MTKDHLTHWGGILLVGVLGMGLFELGWAVTKDLWWLHVVHLNTERAALVQAPK